MEKRSGLSCVAVLLGVFAMVFQAIGLFAPAWVSYEMDVHIEDQNMEVKIQMGLWTTIGCVNSPEHVEECKAFTDEELRDAMLQGDQSETAKVAGLNFLDDFMKLQALASLGAILSVVGMITLGVYRRSDGGKGIGIISALSWTVGAILVISAVGIQGQRVSNLNHGIELLETMPTVSDTIQLKQYFPWAILMSGIGAGLGFLVAVLVTIQASFTTNPEVPGVWNKFSNQAI